MLNKLKNNLNKKKKQRNNKMDLFKLESRLDAIDKRLDKIEKTLFKKDFTESDYWNGDIPDDKFDEALNQYGYEYTPSSYPRTLDSYHAMEQDPHTAQKSHQDMIPLLGSDRRAYRLSALGTRREICVAPAHTTNHRKCPLQCRSERATRLASRRSP